ncbi:DUF445 family protein [Corynebacterium sp. zg331]|nr:DUF445 family protein [Corynebacterium sp. zg331]
MPGPSPEAEARRRRALRAHKAFVTGLLAVAALIFLGCSWWQHHPGGAPGWVGYVRAASEAGMVGGLADWFAVTALFRHPMGLPIPHTALIPKKKDQLGDSLSGFVGENFLNAELITEKVATANLPLHAGRWLADPAHARRVSAEAGRLVHNALVSIDPQDAEAVIRRLLVDKAAEPQWGPPVGRALEQLIDDGKTEPLIDDAIAWAHRRVLGSQDLIIRLLDERKPAWAPRFVNDLVGEKIYRELVNWTADVAADPQHEARRALRRFLGQLALDLQHDAQTIERVEGWKAEIMASRPVTQAAPALWSAASASLIQAVTDPDSLLRRTVADYALHWGQRLEAEPDLRAEVNRKVVAAAAFVADHYSGQITAIISDTVRAWDAQEASEKIELMVGKDLQFIRLNGTLVGALAGLAIYTASQLLFA